MQNNQKNNNSFLINLITLLSFGIGVFLIMFLKRRGYKEVEHESFAWDDDEGSVKNSVQSIDISDLNDRQNRILERISVEGRMEPKEIYRLVPNVSTRTMRRDLDVLIEKGLVSQEGSTKDTEYIYIGR